MDNYNRHGGTVLNWPRRRNIRVLTSLFGMNHPSSPAERAGLYRLGQGGTRGGGLSAWAPASGAIPTAGAHILIGWE